MVGLVGCVKWEGVVRGDFVHREGREIHVDEVDEDGYGCRHERKDRN